MLTRVGSSDFVAEKFGPGAPEVVALHGWGRTGADFAGILAPHSGLALHLPGFGPAPEPPRAWSSADYAREIAAALEDIGPTVLVGHSFGGRIALRLAAGYPHLVKHLVLTGVPLTRVTAARRPALGFRAIKFLRSLGVVPESVVESARQKYGSADYRAASGVMREILVGVVGEDYLEDARAVTCPVTLVWGENDIPAPLAAAQKSLEYFPTATLRVVAGASHLLEGTLEKDVASAVTDALRE
ncbi:MAG: alpha/beta hydrolase [Microbacteriaceae bacterium]|nr:alpha/beta hydrolase [Microbacteriaceae bacterium]